jgi:hypothetical protein
LNDGPFIHDLIEHITNTKDSQNKQGKYMLGNGLEVKHILYSIKIPSWCTRLGDAYLLASVIRRLVSFCSDGDREEALKAAHELSMLYDDQVKP